ncbi:MAG: polyprenyl synthetase family protein [Candidatus Woesearchaeota archaeon]
MNFTESLSRNKREIDHELERFFDARMKKAKGISPEAYEAFQILKEFNLRGGKRIRPMLTISSYRGFGGKNKEITRAALAVELMESFLLIHDDIMDKDAMRRGGPTVHKIYETKFKGAEHYGNSLAIVVGDIASALGSEAIAETGFDARRRIEAIEKFNKVIINTCFGQILDLKSEMCYPKERDIVQIHTLKTAIYTIEGPLHIGAILAGASREQLRQLTRFAIPLGKAFQLKDDILGVFGSAKRIGKPVGSDIRQGKRTLLILKAMEKGNEEDRKLLKRCLGKKSLSSREINKVRIILRSTGSLQYSEQLVKENISLAKSALNEIRMEKESKEFLKGIADYVMERDK